MEYDVEISRLKTIADLLICPDCSKNLNIGKDQVVCASCGARYPIEEGVPLLAREGSPSASAGRGPAGGENTSEAYQKQYQDVRDAAQYNADYKERLFKRMSTRREFRVLRGLLAALGHNKIMLDVPSGGGRLSAQIGEFTDLLIEADIARGQVMYGKKSSTVAVPQIWMTASAFRLPFRDNSVDATVCCRLCHHLPTARERERLVTEILRVSRRFAIMTFFDYRSFKNLLRRMRRPFDRKPPKMTMKIEEVAELAAANGARLLRSPYLAPLWSGHRYAVMVKEGAGL